MAAKKKAGKQIGLSVEETLKEINSKFGAGTVGTLEGAAMDIESITTGSFGLDLALGVGGLPKGRLVEISGMEASGKTTLALHVVAEAQKAGGLCAFIDAEHALDPLYAQKIGVNTANLIINQPDNGEQALEIVETMVRSEKFSVIVVDSVASLTPKAELEGEMGDANIARLARLLGHGLRVLVPLVSKSDTVLIFINQIRTNPGAFPGTNPEYTPGGKALKFYSSVRIDMRRISQIKKGEEIVGSRTRAKVTKNKVSAPYRQTEFDIMYGQGISFEGELLVTGEKYGVISKSGHSYKYGETVLGRGYDSSRIYLRQNKDIATLIKQQIVSAIEAEKVELSEQDIESSNEAGE
jgi:recombination protein RecA